MRRGSFLELGVGKLFEKAGFKTILNQKVDGFEIDVIAKRFGYSIIIECKEHYNYFEVKDIMYEWLGKCKSIGADKVVVVVHGWDIERYKKDAKKMGVLLITGEEILDLLCLGKKELQNKLNELVKFDRKKLWLRKLKKIGFWILGIVIVKIVWGMLF